MISHASPQGLDAIGAADGGACNAKKCYVSFHGNSSLGKWFCLMRAVNRWPVSLQPSSPDGVRSTPWRTWQQHMTGHFLTQRVLVNLAIFHDDDKVLRCIGHEVKIFERIAVDQDQIRVSSFLDDAKRPCLIGMTWTTHRQ